MAELNIPAGPLDEEPLRAIQQAEGETLASSNTQALTEALAGVELGTWDAELLSALRTWPRSTVATICSWLHRVRTAAAPGDDAIILDPPAELGLSWADGGDLLAICDGAIVLYPRGCDTYVMDGPEAREWAAQLAGMAEVLPGVVADGQVRDA
ncbi:hypothetical protein AB0O28_19200 [Microbispora sp. NPDC088329]|uniref:hypothetical protein n=1 Tax=Microbispora sp. NPDC088329 TaxID=3154869 RepID=UPI00341AE96F